MKHARFPISVFLLGGPIFLSIAGAERPKDPPCTACVGAVGMGPSLGTLLSDFETAPFAVSKLGTRWFGFNDAAGRIDITAPSDYSTFTRGAVMDTVNPSAPPALVIQGNGRIGNGAAIEFTLGKKFFPISSFTPIDPFIGLGLALSNDRGDTYDLAADSVKGIYFEYRLAGSGVALVRFEARAYQPDWSVLVDQGRHWWGRSLPATGGTWKGARILFSELVMPEEGKALVDSVRRSLNTREMMFVQWTVYGDTGAAGSFAMDNVHLMGAGSLTPLSVPRKAARRPPISAWKEVSWIAPDGRVGRLRPGIPVRPR